MPVCDNIRMPRSKIYGGDEAYRGDQASKKRYFYGLKIHLMVTETGEPVEFFLSTGSLADVRGLRVFSFDLPVGKYLGKINYTYLTPLLPLASCLLPIFTRKLILHDYLSITTRLV
ncbi:MAG: transposase [Microcystis sp.]